jgi:hypothetical protein
MMMPSMVARSKLGQDALRRQMGYNQVVWGSDGSAMSGHKFKIGQLVNYHGRERAPGVYQITQLLPPEGDEFQYRIKNINEPHERVAKESELRRA